MQFIGRKQEIASLESLFTTQNAHLVVLMGRRRIGKSRLITEFAKNYHFIRFSGIAPTKTNTAQSEREHFIKQLCSQTNATVTKHNWQDLFASLAQSLSIEKTVILFDEISWMATKDPDFLGLLKDAWDYHFSSKKNLMLVLCGSVSAWIEQEIVNSTAFLGRISLHIKLQELRLTELRTLWSNLKFDHLSAYDKFKILAITGGVPRYLELLNLQETADHNIKQLCFNPSSPLLNEYNLIFADIFGKKSALYKKIIDCILNNSQQQTTILQNLQHAKSGAITQYLSDLIEAGFISRDYSWNLTTGKKNKHSRYRLKDNFIRFYLKFIAPNIDRIHADLINPDSLSSLPGWYPTLGLQFENLIVNNIHVIINQLNLVESDIVNFGPFLQTATLSKPGCQIDLLIQTKSNVLFICEIKFSKQPIHMDIISQMQLKMKNFKRPKGLSCLPVLIHINGTTDQVMDSEFFYRIIDFSDII